MLVLLAACLQIVAGRAGAQASEFQVIEASLTDAGPEQTLRTYFKCGTDGGYSLIRTGNPRAVEIAVKLLEVSDACYTESLLSSLATAMQKNPDAVLAHMPAIQHLKLDPENFCVPFIDEDTPRADALAVLDRSERALAKVSKPELQEARRTCANVIRQYRRDMDAAEAFRKNNAR